jgi:hypothetical protein
MARKFLIIVAGIVAVMAAVILYPGVSGQDGDISITYYRDIVIQTDQGLYDVSGHETLIVKNDGSASHTGPDGQAEREFTISKEEMKVLKELFLNTGFMQIPKTDYQEKAGLGNFTRYELSVQSEGDSQLIRWVNPEAANEAIPSIIINSGSRLDDIIERNP